MFRVFFLCILCFSSSLASQNRILEELDQEIPKQLQEWEVPGLAIGVIQDGKLLFMKGYGVRDVHSQAPVDEKTLFAIGSTTKAFTTAALAMLVDEGQLTWDDSVVDLLPGFYLFDPYISENCTVCDLLTHRTGLGDHDGDLLWYRTKLTRKEIMDRLCYLKPTTGFREMFNYQNVLYLAAGQIIPKLTNKSWDLFIHERIFQPLEMHNSYTELGFMLKTKNYASPHYVAHGKLLTEPWYSVRNIGPAGSIVSNVEDISKWLIFQLSDGGKLVSQEQMDLMHTPHMVIGEHSVLSKLFPYSSMLAYGFGWLITDFEGEKLIAHDGLINCMSSCFVLLPKQKAAVVVLVNRENSLLPEAAAFAVCQKILNKKTADYNKEFLALAKEQEENSNSEIKSMEKEKIPDTKPTLALEKYTGTYDNDLYGPIEVYMKDGKLLMDFLAATGPLHHYHYDTFQFYPEERNFFKPLVTFYIDVDGTVGSFELPYLLENEVFVKRETGSSEPE